MKLYHTVVWKKFIVVENIHTKIIHCKKFLPLLVSDEIFTIEFFQFKLGAISPVSVGQEAVIILKWKSVKETVVYMLPSLQGMWLLEKNGSNVKGTNNKSDR